MKRSPTHWLVAALVLAALGLGSLRILGGRGGPARGESGGSRTGVAASRLDPGPATSADAPESRSPSLAVTAPADAPDAAPSARTSATPLEGEDAPVWVHFTGAILGADTHAPLEGVRVSVALGERRFEAVTDAQGTFALEIPAPRADVSLAHDRCVDRNLPDLDLASPAHFELAPSATLIGWMQPAAAGVEVRVWHQAASGQRFWNEHRPGVDAAGHFELGDLTPGQYLVSARTPAGTSTHEAGIMLAAGETKTITLPSSGGAEIHGRITRRGAGLPVAGAALRFEPRDDLPRVLREAGRRGTVAGADGRYALEALTPGKYRVEVEAEGCGPVSFTLDVPASGERIERDVELAGAGTILGLVVDAGGAPVAGVALHLWGKGSRALDDELRPPDATSAPDGSFRIDGVAPGARLTLVGVPPGGAPLATLQLEGPPPDGTRSGVRLELPASGSILGLVLDERGLPVVGARLEARSLVVSGLRMAQASSDAEGRFELRGLQGGRVRVVAQAHGHLDARTTVTVAETQASECQLVLEGTHALAGLVLDADGAGIADLPVRALSLGGAPLELEAEDEPFTALTRSDAFGAFVFDELPARVFEIDASSYEWERVASEPAEVHVPADEAVVVRVQARQRSERFTITGEVTLADHELPTELRFRGLVGGLLEVDGGLFRASGLTPTRQTLWVSRDGYAAERIGPIEPIPGGVVDVGWIELHPATLLTVRLVDAHKKPVSGARVVLEPLPLERGGIGESRTIVLPEAKNGHYRAWVRPFAWRLRAEAEQGKSAKTVRVKAQEKQGLTLAL